MGCDNGPVHTAFRLREGIAEAARQVIKRGLIAMQSQALARGQRERPQIINAMRVVGV